MQPKPVRSFARGLAVLEALNAGGTASALQLARRTGIARGTVYRLLQTLQDAGYVERGAGDDRFRLRLKVRQLAGGFEDEHWIAGVARPALLALTRRISWPCDVLTFQDLRMVIRDTTHPTAPLSIDRNMAGRDIPMLGSAAGLTYLAFAPAQERAQILGLLARLGSGADGIPDHGTPDAGIPDPGIPDPGIPDPGIPDAGTTARIIAATRRRGYGLRQGGPVWPHTGAVALPVRHGGRVLGCISVIWMARVVPGREGLRLCLAPLRETRAQIEHELAGS